MQATKRTGKHNYTAITSRRNSEAPATCSDVARLLDFQVPCCLCRDPRPNRWGPGPVVGGKRRAPCRIWPTNVALRHCSWAAPPKAASWAKLRKVSNIEYFHTKQLKIRKIIARHKSPSACSNLTHPRLLGVSATFSQPQTSSARSIFEKSTSRSWTSGTSSDAVTTALDAGTSVGDQMISI